jgi:hypothetical protein
MQHLESAGLPPAHAPVARGIRAAAAVMITLVAPVISMSGALTTGLNGTSPAVKFPPGYGVALAATVAATTVAAILAALIARRDALVAIPASLGLWALIGVSVVAEGTQLGHTGLTGWGWILVAASVIAAAAGTAVAAHRGQANQRPGPRTRHLPASDRGHAQSARR